MTLKTNCPNANCDPDSESGFRFAVRCIVAEIERFEDILPFRYGSPDAQSDQRRQMPDATKSLVSGTRLV